jgi:hypothetical protein
VFALNQECFWIRNYLHNAIVAVKTVTIAFSLTN